MTEKDSHLILAQEYFGDLARRFPVMCASDEFHFLPRAQAAADYYDKLDDARRIEYIKNIQTASQSAKNLLDNLLQWSQSQTGKIEVNSQKTDLVHTDIRCRI